ncbi:MAG TPA: transcriptional regulator NrdR [Acidobacteriota bacterium]|nr:transcriptional regulator NrdR [Acidobacteriota bacterium]
MKCPYCTSAEHKVVDKRETPDGKAYRRRRECLSCKKRFTTYERIEQVEIIVIKKDNSRVPFDRNKLLSGIQRACQKRPVSFESMQEMVNEIESTLLNQDTVEVTTKQIGELVMKQLKKADKVAYIRFASVYKEFEDVEAFQEELKKLVKK